MPKGTFAENFSGFPIFRILTGTILGIISEDFFQCGILVGLLGIVFFLLFFRFFPVKKLGRKFVFIHGFSFYALWFFFGIFIYNFQKCEAPNNNFYDNQLKIAVVETPLEEKAKTFKTLISVYDSSLHKNSNVLAYFEKQDSLPECGDLIAFASLISPIKNPQNPFEFDFAKYMQRQGVFCSVYIKKNEYKILEKASKKSFTFYGAKMREKLLSIYRSCEFSEQSLAVLEALTLGYKSDLDEETISKFQKSGSMHILAVSGLHTGIIVLILDFLLKFLDYSQRGRILKFFLTIVLLWLFAMITGFTPSVSRSALMFSFFAFSKVLNRHSSSYATLAFSCFVLLVINPFLIFNVGFLLSYSAVLSILAVVPLFDRFLLKVNFVTDSVLVCVSKNIANYFIQLLCVSISAQVGTGILSMLVFRIFPVYFMLTNLIVIPLAFLIMIFGVALLVFNPLTFLSDFVFKGLNFLLNLLINSVSWIENLPGGCIENIFMTKFSAFLAYCSVVVFVIYLIYKKIRALKFSLFVFILFLISCIIYKSVVSSDNLVVWNCGLKECISIFNSDSCVVISKTKDFSFRPLETMKKFKKTSVTSFLSIDSLSRPKDCVFFVDDKTILVLNSSEMLDYFVETPIHFDYLVLTSGFSSDLEELEKLFSPKQIIKTNDKNREKAFLSGFLSENLWKFF